MRKLIHTSRSLAFSTSASTSLARYGRSVTFAPTSGGLCDARWALARTRPAASGLVRAAAETEGPAPAPAPAPALVLWATHVWFVSWPPPRAAGEAEPLMALESDLKLQKPGDAEISSVTSVPGRLPTQAVPDLFSSTDHHTIADSPGQSMSMDHHEKVTTAIWSVEGANQCTPEHTHSPHASHTLPTAPCTPLDTSVSPVYSSVLKACPY